MVVVVAVVVVEGIPVFFLLPGVLVLLPALFLLPLPLTIVTRYVLLATQGKDGLGDGLEISQSLPLLRL